MSLKIDFVVLWVNGTDSKWLAKKNKYQKIVNPDAKANSESRYRDFNIFNYWFRAVENYAPWVNNIFVITDQQQPSWLNLNNPKIKLIDHKDYIPSEYLPTFNSNVIELNLNRLTTLSEHFVLFNDDMMLNAKVSENDFFIKGLPRDFGIQSIINPIQDNISNVILNDTAVINKYFSKKEVIKNNWHKFYSLSYGNNILRNLALAPYSNFRGFWNPHLPVSYCKSVFDDVWRKENRALLDTSTHKFRMPTEYSHWLMRYWQIVSGKFYPQHIKFGKYYNLENDLDEAAKDIANSQHKLICLNDSDSIDFSSTQRTLSSVLKTKFPEKSKYEI